MLIGREANRSDPVWSEVAKLQGGRTPVAILGATGSVGQTFIELLGDHPWFKVEALAASEGSVGRKYGEVVRWIQKSPLAPEVADLEIRPTEPASAKGCRLVFSALDSDSAGPIETVFAETGHVVVSNAGYHRLDEDVPLLVPEVNADHLALIRAQKFGHGGALLTNPNGSTIGLVLALKPLVDHFGVERVHAVTMQAVSGAGVARLPSVMVLDNLIPFIPQEEEKIEQETRKILGKVVDGKVEGHDLVVSAACNRVPVSDGHTICVSVKLREKASLDELKLAWENFAGQPQLLNLPLAPEQAIHYIDAPDAPQPRLHRYSDRGMAIVIGRARTCPLFDYKFVTLSHNTLRGAAGGALLIAELAIARGLVEGLHVEQ